MLLFTLLHPARLTKTITLDTPQSQDHRELLTLFFFPSNWYGRLPEEKVGCAHHMHARTRGRTDIFLTTVYDLTIIHQCLRTLQIGMVLFSILTTTQSGIHQGLNYY